MITMHPWQKFWYIMTLSNHLIPPVLICEFLSKWEDPGRSSDVLSQPNLLKQEMEMGIFVECITYTDMMQCILWEC